MLAGKKRIKIKFKATIDPQTKQIRHFSLSEKEKPEISKRS